MHNKYTKNIEYKDLIVVFISSLNRKFNRQLLKTRQDLGKTHVCLKARTTDAQWSLFSLKSQTFGLGQTIWADRFGGIWGTAFISKPKYYLGLGVEFGLQRNQGFSHRVSVVRVLRDRSHWLWIHLSSHSILLLLYFLQQITVISTQVFWLLVVRCEKSVH